MTPSFWSEISALICNFTCEGSGNYKDLDKSKRGWNYSVISFVTIWLHLFQSLEASSPDPTPLISLPNSSSDFRSNIYVRTNFEKNLKLCVWVSGLYWTRYSHSETPKFAEKYERADNVSGNHLFLNFQGFFSCIVFNIGQINTIP